MNRQRFHWFLISVLTLTLNAGRGHGQNLLDERLKISHNLDLLEMPGDDAEAVLEKRLQSLNLKELLKGKGLDPQMVDELIKKDPSLFEKAKQFAKQQGIDLANPKTEANQAKIRKFLDQFMPNGKFDPSNWTRGKLPDFSNAPTPEFKPEVNGGGNSPSVPETIGGEPPSMPNSQLSLPNSLPNNPLSNSPLPESPMPEFPFSKQLGQMAERMQKLDPSIKSSKGWQEAMKRLSQTANFDESRWKTFASQFDKVKDKYGKVGNSQNWEKMFSNMMNYRWPKALTPNHVPPIKFPTGSGSGSKFSGGSSSFLPSPSMGGGIGGGKLGSGSTLVWVLAFLAFGVTLFFLLRHKAKGAGIAAALRSRRRSDWVNPAQLMTREDLIRAFENLAVSDCGEAAITWNHRQIASELGQRHQPLAEEACQLANVYETARYSPPKDPLPESLFAQARRSLQLLAGVARS